MLPSGICTTDYSILLQGLGNICCIALSGHSCGRVDDLAAAAKSVCVFPHSAQGRQRPICTIVPDARTFSLSLHGEARAARTEIAFERRQSSRLIEGRRQNDEAGLTAAGSLLRTLQAWPLRLLPTRARPHECVLAVDKCTADVPICTASRIQFHGCNCHACLEARRAPRRHRDGLHLQVVMVAEIQVAITAQDSCLELYVNEDYQAVCNSN